MEDIERLAEHVSRIVEQRSPRPTADAATERAKASFSVEKMAMYVNSGSENIQKRCAVRQTEEGQCAVGQSMI